MHYIPCEHCGHFNPIKSEYQVFCEKCNHKLSLNYKDWHKKNAGKNLDDFKTQLGVSEEAIAARKKEGNKKKRKLTKAQVWGIIVGAIVAVLVGQFGKQLTQKVMENFSLKQLAKMEFQASDTTQWVTYKNSEANFEVLFPEQPKENVQQVDTEIGPMQVKIYTFEPELGKDDNLTYGAGFSVYPPELVDGEVMAVEEINQFMENSVNGAVANVQGKLMTVNSITYNGLYPGRELRIDFKNGAAVIIMRCYLVRNKMYITEVIAPSQNSSNQSIDTFLNSFKLQE